METARPATLPTMAAPLGQGVMSQAASFFAPFCSAALSLLPFVGVALFAVAVLVPLLVLSFLGPLARLLPRAPLALLAGFARVVIAALALGVWARGVGWGWVGLGGGGGWGRGVCGR